MQLTGIHCIKDKAKQNKSSDQGRLGKTQDLKTYGLS
jgi:hypothetical protein